MDVDCLKCQTRFAITPRTSKWPTSLPALIECPNCHDLIRWRFAKMGALPNQEAVVLLQEPGYPDIVLQEYNCTTLQAKAFAVEYRVAWQQIPQSARAVIRQYWGQHANAPFVYLLNHPDKWCGSGWAAATNDACTMFYSSQIVPLLPNKCVHLMVAHEIAHALLIASNESLHLRRIAGDGSVTLACERLVWDLTEAWGFDQLGTEEWMERTFDETTGTPVRRAAPLDVPSEQLNCVQKRSAIMESLREVVFPENLRHFMA